MKIKLTHFTHRIFPERSLVRAIFSAFVISN